MTGENAREVEEVREMLNTDDALEQMSALVARYEKLSRSGVLARFIEKYR